MNDHSGLTSSPRRTSTLIASAALGVLLGSGLSLVVWVLATRRPLPDLTPQRLHQAQQRWKASGPDSYTLEILLGTTNPNADDGSKERIVVQVRQGEVVHAERRPGGPLPRRSWAYWSVPGLFDVLQRDLENRQRSQKVFGVSDPSMIVLRCRFDPQYGFPTHYQRYVRTRGMQSQWVVVRFQPEP